MRLQVTMILLLSPLLLEARRVRVQPVEQEQEQDEQVQYYAAEPRGQRVVLVSADDSYNGYYGQPTAASRAATQENYIPSRADQLVSKGRPHQHKEHTKQPPVQTIRNYNKVNDDGSFTFGYEAADGSFKEETRGTDCVVRGKYGYVDPDGNKREFTYVSGNPCDPNAPQNDQDDAGTSEEESDVPANYPVRRPETPNYPRTRPTVAPKPVAIYQGQYEEERSEEEQVEPEQILRQQPVRRPQYYTSRPQYTQQPAVESQVYQTRPTYQSTTPASVIYKHQHTLSPVSITPRPVAVTQPTRTQLPATTYRPQLIQASVTPRPSILYTKTYPSTIRPQVSSVSSLDFDSDYQKFQSDNLISPTPTPIAKTTPKYTIKTSSPSSVDQIYSSALVFDPATGQYKTQLYQTLPQTDGDFTVNHRLQPYVHQSTRQPVINIQQLQQRTPAYLRPVPQAAYQQQQAELQYQNSAQLYAQQQRSRSHQQVPKQVPKQAQQYYYFQPSQDQSQGLAAGQIDAFLRGHNIQF